VWEDVVDPRAGREEKRREEKRREEKRREEKRREEKRREEKRRIFATPGNLNRLLGDPSRNLLTTLTKL
jgi:hypothetical protein